MQFQHVYAHTHTNTHHKGPATRSNWDAICRATLERIGLSRQTENCNSTQMQRNLSHSALRVQRQSVKPRNASRATDCAQSVAQPLAMCGRCLGDTSMSRLAARAENLFAEASQRLLNHPRSGSSSKQVVPEQVIFTRLPM